MCRPWGVCCYPRNGVQMGRRLLDVSRCLPRRRRHWLVYLHDSHSPPLNRLIQGAGNSFLGGLAAGLLLENGDVYQGTLISGATGPASQRAPQLHFMRPYRPRSSSSSKGCQPCLSIHRVKWKSGTRIPLGADLKHYADARVVNKDDVANVYNIYTSVHHALYGCCCGCANLARLSANSSSCFACNSSGVSPESLILSAFFSRSCVHRISTPLARCTPRTFCCCLWSLRTSSTSDVNESNPRRCKQSDGEFTPQPQDLP